MRLIIILLILTSPCVGRTIIQIKDFLCGCEYCKTIDTGEALDIGRHIISCHSWRDATLKTMALMNKTKKPKLKDKTEIESSEIKESSQITNDNQSNKQNYKWHKDAEDNWIFSDLNNLLNNDGWIYREYIGWLWAFNKKIFLYSEKYGWLYNYSFNNKKIYYWYDRRKWIFPNKIPKHN